MKPGPFSKNSVVSAEDLPRKDTLVSHIARPEPVRHCIAVEGLAIPGRRVGGQPTVAPSPTTRTLVGSAPFPGTRAPVSNAQASRALVSSAASPAADAEVPPAPSQRSPSQVPPATQRSQTLPRPLNADPKFGRSTLSLASVPTADLPVKRAERRASAGARIQQFLQARTGAVGLEKARLNFEIGRELEWGLDQPAHANHFYTAALADNPTHIPTVQGCRRTALRLHRYRIAAELVDREIRLTSCPIRRQNLREELTQILLRFSSRSGEHKIQ